MTRATRLCSLFAVLAVLASLGCKTLNHFKVYDVEDQPKLQVVRLTDQFSNDREGRVEYLTHFATPVRKIHGEDTIEIKDEDAHLTWYRLDQQDQEPKRRINFVNQFGAQKVDTGKPVFLLVPAEKTSDPDSKPPKKLDHFKCYEVVEVLDAPEAATVELTDQFGTEQEVSVGALRLFCLPAVKNDPNGELHNKAWHLAVYELPPQTAGATEKASASDQFGDWDLVLEQTVFLCVPSLKGEVEEGV